MIRSMMQVYVKNSLKALKTYEEAFQTSATQIHYHEDGSILHAELNIHGQTLALSEVYETLQVGNSMQFCFQFDEKDVPFIEHAYQVLKSNGQIIHPLGETFYSPLMFSLVDCYGINWCLFVSS